MGAKRKQVVLSYANRECALRSAAFFVNGRRFCDAGTADYVLADRKILNVHMSEKV